MREKAFVIPQTLLQERGDIFTEAVVRQNTSIRLGLFAITAPQRSIRIPHLDPPITAIGEIAKPHLSSIKRRIDLADALEPQYCGLNKK
jgi:hypothetical protein